MKFTNKHNLPEPLVRALSQNKYSSGGARASITTLIGSPQVAILKKEHAGEIEVDVMDRLWSLFGTTVHNIIEEGSAGLADYIAEERIFSEVDGWEISGGIDVQHFLDGRVGVRDWKVTSAYAVMNGKADWERQLNAYAYLIEKEKGVPVGDIKIGAIIRDWKRYEAEIKPDYPRNPVEMIDIPLWPYEERERYILDRVRLHKDAQRAREWGEPLPECTPEEMWERPTVWAVIKPGALRARSVHQTEEEAEANLKPGYVKEGRPGSRVKCESYCEVSQWCAQHQAFMNRL